MEDTAFFVEAYDAATGTLALSDRTNESLDPATLAADPDDALRCTVKGRFPARFTHAAQAELLAAVELKEGSAFVRCGDKLLAAPQLGV